MFQITSDRTPPTMTLSVADGAAIQTLDDVVITLADAIDPSPKLTSIALVGGLPMTRCSCLGVRSRKVDSALSTR